MREFDQPIGEHEREVIQSIAQSIFDDAEPKRAVRASEFAMEDEPDRIVVHEVDLKWGDGNRLRIASTQENARPPFEWLLEITSDIGETDYFKHYLIRANDIVLAQRKVLTPIDKAEARVILHDLALAQKQLK
jgi:hypothetical protein